MKEKDLIKKSIEEEFANKNTVYNKVIAKQKTKKQIKLTVFSVAACIIVFLVCSMLIYVPVSPRGATPQLAKSYNEVYKAINNYKELSNLKTFDPFSFMKAKSRSTSDLIAGDMNAAAPESSAEFEAPKDADVSKSNIQTEGIDEGDIVKWDDNYIYKINASGLTIIKVNNGQLSESASISIDNYVPIEMYLNGDKLVIIGGIYENLSIKSGNQIEPMVSCYAYIPYQKTDIRVYEITDRESPILSRQITVSGHYNTSRLVENEGKLVFLSSYNFNPGYEDESIPKIYDSAFSNTTDELFDIGNIYYYEDIPSYYYMIIGSIMLNNPEVKTKTSAYLGLSGEVYVSDNSVYISSYDPCSGYAKNLFGYYKRDYDYSNSTRVVQISLKTLKQTASGRIEGSIINRYAMDEYNGFLRVATTSRKASTYNNLFVLDMNLKVVGSVDNIAPGESIYSARFNKDKGSIVTFVQVDPYFFFDLSDPYNPKITGEIKEDGVSYYIHYIGDSGFTIGIGKNSVNGIITGLKVSLYYNDGSETPENVSTLIYNGEFYVEMFHNPIALLYDESRNMFAFTYQNWTYSNYNTNLSQGLMVFNFNLEEKEITLKGVVSNISETKISYYYDYMYEYVGFISRGLRIGDYLYTVSEKYIKSYNIEDLTPVDEIVISDKNIFDN